MYTTASLSDSLDFGMGSDIEARSDCLHAFAKDLVISTMREPTGVSPLCRASWASPMQRCM